jgi:hypothetical protein
MFSGTTRNTSSLSWMAITLLESAFNISKIMFFNEIGGVVGYIYAFVFEILFNFILLPYFFSIIIVIYNELRE